MAGGLQPFISDLAKKVNSRALVAVFKSPRRRPHAYQRAGSGRQCRQITGSLSALLQPCYCLIKAAGRQPLIFKLHAYGLALHCQQSRHLLAGRPPLKNSVSVSDTRHAASDNVVPCLFDNLDPISNTSLSACILFFGLTLQFCNSQSLDQMTKTGRLHINYAFAKNLFSKYLANQFNQKKLQMPIQSQWGLRSLRCQQQYRAQTAAKI